MKRLISIIPAVLFLYATAQKPGFNTYFDTAYWNSEDVDTATELATLEPVFRLDTIVGNKYGKYSQFALKYVESVFGTKVGDGLCGRVGERMCELAHADMVLKYRAMDGDVSRMEVGDIIVFPQFLKYGGKGWVYDNSAGAEHLAMFIGMKDDSTILIADQNSSGGPTFYTQVVVREIYLAEMKFFNGNNHHVPYFDVYGYQPRKVLKKEYSFLSGKK